MKNLSSKQFWDLIAKPTIEEFHQTPDSFQRTALAVWALDAMVSHLCWDSEHNSGIPNEASFKDKLVTELPSYNSIREASNSFKHAIRNPKAQTEGSNSIEIRQRGWGEAEWGVDEFDGPPIPLITFITGHSSSLKHSIKEVTNWIEAKLPIDT